MKLAIVHDYLNQFGGAERVVLALSEIFPDAPIYTSIYDEKRLPQAFKRLDIRVSFMQRLPFVFPLFKAYFLVYPFAFESFDLSQYDVILSSSSAWAKGVKTNKRQLHLCYCHTPMRFVWRYEDYVKKESFPAIFKAVLPMMLLPVKQWDLQTAGNVNQYIANSQTVAERIQRIYGRDSVIINPPVDCNLFVPKAFDLDYFLVISRLNAYKRIDLVVEAFNQLELPLKIVGDGPCRRALQEKAKANIEFVGRLPDQQLAECLSACRALIFPGEEDFGIVPLEAMACGRPVIAYDAGGARETVVAGKTGLFFEQQTAQALVKVIKEFQFMTFEKVVIRQQAAQFSQEIFAEKIKSLVNQKYQQFYESA